jgi:hypothetical protein
MKRLLSTLSQKWPEYLIEAIVIVASILGAYALDNWNDDRKDREKERTLLINLKRDFQLRQNELLEFEEARKKTFSSLSDMYKAMANQDSPPDKSKLDTCLVYILNAMTFNDQFKMLDALFSTGMINDLKDEDLKQRLLIWPQQVEEMMEEQRSRLEIYFNYLYPLLLKHVALREIYEQMGFRGYNLPKGQAPTYVTNYPGLLAEPTFERTLGLLEAKLIVNDRDSKILLENVEKILERIDQLIK